MSDSIPTLKVHPPKQEEDGESDRGEGEGEEKTEAVRVEEEPVPAPSLSDELTSMSQLKEEPPHGAAVMEDGQTASGERQEDEPEEREKDAVQGAGAEADGEGGGGTEASKGISKVQSVFALVRNRVRSQSSADWSQGRGILGVVQQATRDLVKAQGRPAVETSQEASSSGASQGSGEGDSRESPVVMERGPEGESTPEREQDLEVRESKLEGKDGGGGEGGEEVLRSMEALRQELKEEITRLRLDVQLALAGLEARLTHSLHTHANASATLAKQSAATEMGSAHGGAERRPRPPVIVGAATAEAVPSSHGVRRRALYRTLTTLTSTTCPPPPVLPRSRSEPMGGRTSLARRPSNGAEAAGRLPPPPQHTRKPLRFKTRLA